MPIMLPKYLCTWTFGVIQPYHQDDRHRLPGEAMWCLREIHDLGVRAVRGSRLYHSLVLRRISRRFLIKSHSFLH